MSLNRYLFPPLFYCLILSLLSACATPISKEYRITGSNRSTQIIELSYEFKSREKVTVKEGQALQLALQRCQMWGYQEAIQLQEEAASCIQPSAYNCLVTRATIKYQCN